MNADLTRLMENWDGLGVVVRFDGPTGAWIFICLHNCTLGPCTGGTRMKVYDTLADGLEDGMRLAEGMTSKWASIHEKCGGGKSVIALDRLVDGEERQGLLRRYGALIQSLNGAFRTGEDLGTTSEDMKVIGSKTSYVHGFHPTTGEKIDPSPYTAQGVFAGLKSAVEVVFGSSDLSGRSVLIQGTGNVGTNLGRLLARSGARILVSDIDEERAALVAQELAGTVVPSPDVYSTECDVYAPCAIGATLNSETIPQLNCRIVAGSANNQLQNIEDASRLLERGVVYAPDYVVNAGGALSFALMDRGLGDHEALLKETEVIGSMITEILTEANVSNETPVAIATKRVDRILTATQSGS
jgi:leucine dehydrogenase